MSIQFTPFRQTPVWSEDETFNITGKQLNAIQDMFKAYTPFITALESVFTDGLDSGKITIKYEDLDGNPLTRETIDEMLKQYAEDMVASMKKD
jgi:hypothetical protein